MTDPELIDYSVETPDSPDSTEKMPEPEGKDPHAAPPERGFSGVNPAIIILIVSGVLIVLFVLFALINTSSKTVYVNRTSEMEHAVIVEIPVNISIENYSNIKDFSYDEKISILAFLKQQDIVSHDQGIYTYRYITDSFNNTIKLHLDFYGQKAYEGLFIVNQTSSQSYRISGSLKYSLGEFAIEVKSIVPEDRDRINVTAILRENVTVSEKQSNGFFG